MISLADMKALKPAFIQEEISVAYFSTRMIKNIIPRGIAKEIMKCISISVLIIGNFWLIGEQEEIYRYHHVVGVAIVQLQSTRRGLS